MKRTTFRLRFPRNRACVKLLPLLLLLWTALFAASSDAIRDSIALPAQSSTPSAQQAAMRGDSTVLSDRPGTDTAFGGDSQHPSVSQNPPQSGVDTLTTLPPDSLADSLGIPLDPAAPLDSIADSLAAADSLAGAPDTLGRVTDSIPAPPSRLSSQTTDLYPGISPAQDKMALTLIDRIWAFDWGEVDRIGRRMQRLERREQLPPLSHLLLIAANVVRIQNRAFTDRRAEEALRRDVVQLARKGLQLSDPQTTPDSLRPTNLLIYGGIKGLVATLQLERNLLAAAREGFAALKILERLAAKQPTIYDAHVGLGIFYCALSKAPGVVRATVSMVTRTPGLEQGLDYLRISAAKGRYTSAFARLYLIQFLSPYYGHLAQEKKQLFRSLESDYPSNPYFLFLELDENLCFHPDQALSTSIRQRVKQRIQSFKAHDNASRRYLNLVKWQYLLIDPLAANDIKPDSKDTLGEFAYYPVFLSALREKYLLGDTQIKSRGLLREKLHFIRDTGDHAMELLQSSPMSSSWKGFYTWHMRDALRR